MANLKWEDLPPEIQTRMLEEQVNQNNSKDSNVFKKEILECKSGGGFDWCLSTQGTDFWEEILLRNNINHFYTLYPKESQSTKDEFKKGDYIVTLVNSGDCGKINYCSKQREDRRTLKPEIDTEGGKNNVNSTFDFTDKSNTKWRYATPEEAAEYERIGKPYDVTTLSTSPFIVGKWYKYDGWYIKYLKHNSRIWQASEYICDSKLYHKHKSAGSFGSNDSEKILLEDLSEIQQYLPEGHPDKVVDKAEPHEIPNKSLVGRYLKVIKKFSSIIEEGDYLKITNDLSEYNCYDTKEYGVLSKDRVKNKEVELMPEGFKPDNDIIPEYVECIKNTNIEEYGIVGRIYKFNDMYGPHVGVICNLKCGYYSPGNILYFEKNDLKPSTKEAYDAQFISKKEFVLPEKWCIKTTKENIKYLNDYLKHNSHKYKNYLASWMVGVGYYFHSESPHSNSVCHSKDDIATGFKEITFEQFKEYVFKNMYQKGSFITVNENTIYDNNKSDDRITYNESIQKEPTLYIKPKQNLLYTEDFKTNELDLPTLIKPKKSLLINL